MTDTTQAGQNLPSGLSQDTRAAWLSLSPTLSQKPNETRKSQQYPGQDTWGCVGRSGREPWGRQKLKAAMNLDGPKLRYVCP